MTYKKVLFRFPTHEYPEVPWLLNKIIEDLPNEAREFLDKNPVIFSADYKACRADAFKISLEEFGEAKALIHLQHNIWDYDEEKIKRIIFHEVAHIFLGHINPLDKSDSEFKEQYDKQEKEANELTNKWLNL